MDVKQIDAGELNVGYVDAGPEHGPAVLLLHGWPYDIYAYTEVTPMLVEAGCRVIVPYLRGYGTTRFLSADAPRNGEQAVLAVDATALMDALQIERATVAGFDWGSRTAAIMAALWPERCSALVAVSGYLIGSVAINQRPLPPTAELGWWYLFYFSTERGWLGYRRNTREFNKLIWQLASPKWAFDDATFDRTAAAFDNPDHVDIVIHNYRWRLGLAEGEQRYVDVEQRLAERPPSRCRRSRSPVTSTGPTPTARPTPTGSPAPISTGSSTASGPTCRRRRRPLSPKPSSNSHVKKLSNQGCNCGARIPLPP